VLPPASELEIAMLGRSGEVFGDDVVAAAMIDRLVHRGMNAKRVFQPSERGQFSTAVDKSDMLLRKGMLGLVYYSDSSRPPDPVSTKRGQAQ
jgi:hypothetical protein